MIRGEEEICQLWSAIQKPGNCSSDGGCKTGTGCINGTASSNVAITEVDQNHLSKVWSKAKFTQRISTQDRLRDICNMELPPIAAAIQTDSDGPYAKTADWRTIDRIKWRSGGGAPPLRKRRSNETDDWPPLQCQRGLLKVYSSRPPRSTFDGRGWLLGATNNFPRSCGNWRRNDDENKIPSLPDFGAQLVSWQHVHVCVVWFWYRQRSRRQFLPTALITISIVLNWWRSPSGSVNSAPTIEVPGSKHALAAQCLNWFPSSVQPNTLKGLAKFPYYQ